MHNLFAYDNNGKPIRRIEHVRRLKYLKNKCLINGQLKDIRELEGDERKALEQYDIEQAQKEKN